MQDLIHEIVTHVDRHRIRSRIINRRQWMSSTNDRSGVGRAAGEYERWKAEHARMTELAAKGSVTQKLVDETLNQLQAADAARQEADANVKSAEASLRAARANVQKSQADLVAAGAQQK